MENKVAVIVNLQRHSKTFRHVTTHEKNRFRWVLIMYYNFKFLEIYI